MGRLACRGLVSALVLLAALGVSPTLRAQDGTDDAGGAETGADDTAGAKKRVLIGKLSGAKTQSAREWIVQAFEADGGYELVPEETALALKTGASEEDVAAAAAAEKADVVVLGRSSLEGQRGWVAEVRVYEGTTGKLIEKVEVSGKSFESYERNLSLGEAFLGLAAQAQVWPRPEEAPEEESASEAPVAAASVATPAAPSGNPEWHSPLRLLVGSRLISRSFTYTDKLSDSDPTAAQPVDYPRYTLPMPRAEVRWYPAGHFTEGWASQLGIVAGYEIAVGQKLGYDQDGDGVAEQALSETHDFWFAGARGRIPVGNIAFGVQVDYGMHRSILSGDADADGLPVFPDVNYSQLELGADFEWRIEQMIVGLHGSYNIVLGVGEIGEDVNTMGAETTPWFPGTQGTAVDFGAYVGWRLSRVFDVLVGLDMRAYGLDFGTIPPGSVDPAQRVIAGGATDRYMSAWLALAVKLPAKGQAAGAEAAPGGAAPAAEAEDDFGSFD